MKLVESIVDAFILTAGITPPSPAKRRIATIFIVCGLFGTAAGLVAFFLFAVTHIRLK